MKPLNIEFKAKCFHPVKVEAFLLTNSIPADKIVVAIGNTTRDYLYKKGIHDVLIPPLRSMFSIAELICGLPL